MRKIKNLKLKIILSIGLISCFLSLDSNFAHAQNLSVGVYPPILQIQADPPAKVNSQITIQNLSDQNMSYSISYAPFKAGDLMNGLPAYEEGLSPIYRDLFTKIQIKENDKAVNSVDLMPKQKKALELNIDISPETDLGDYYFSIIFTSSTTNEKNETSFTGAKAGIASNVLLSVGPETRPEGQIIDFSSPKFLTSGPIGFKLNLANTGKKYFTIKGNVKVTNMFGQVVGNINVLPVNVLSNSQRLIPSEKNPDPQNPKIFYDEEFLMGIYTAEAKIALSDDGPIVIKKLTFFAFPTEAIIAVSLIFIFLVGVIRKIKRKSEETS